MKDYTAEDLRAQALMLEKMGAPHYGPMTIQMLQQGAKAIQQIAKIRAWAEPYDTGEDYAVAQREVRAILDAADKHE